MSFIADRVQMEGLTFDDVLLIPAFSNVLPREVSLASKFSRRITLNVPIVSAVKRAENGMIYDPVTILCGSTVRQALDMMAEYHIGGIPVVDNDMMLRGIVTNRDLRFERNLDRKVDEVMTSENLITTDQSTDLEKAADILQRHKIEKLGRFRKVDRTRYVQRHHQSQRQTVRLQRQARTSARGRRNRSYGRQHGACRGPCESRGRRDSNRHCPRAFCRRGLRA